MSQLNSEAFAGRVSERNLLKKIAIVLLRALAAFGVFLVAWSLFDPNLRPLMPFDPRALMLAALLLAAGIIDRAKGIVPMEITIPLMLAGVVRAIVFSDLSFLLYGFALAIIYLFNVIGGGDLKLLMGMFGLWPHVEFFIVMETVILATHLPIVIHRRLRNKDLREQLQTGIAWLHVKWIDFMTGQTTPQNILQQAIVHRPTPEVLSQRGDRLAIAFSLAGIIYLFLATPVGLNWHL